MKTSTYAWAIRCRTSPAATASTMRAISVTMLSRTLPAVSDSSHSASSHSCEGSKSCAARMTAGALLVSITRTWAMLTCTWVLQLYLYMSLSTVQPERQWAW
eukprot:1140957-Pelagomonas_calceolata.AAC.6